MARKEDYSHWNEEAERVMQQENDPESPLCDMSDDEIKETVYNRMLDNDDDHPLWWEE